jgi:hypothetical protein
VLLEMGVSLAEEIELSLLEFIAHGEPGAKSIQNNKTTCSAS